MKNLSLLLLIIGLISIVGCDYKSQPEMVLEETKKETEVAYVELIEEKIPEIVDEGTEVETETEVIYKELTEQKIPENIKLDVPFTSQAPYGDWSEPYQEACEEASIIMVKHYISKESIDPGHVNAEIHEMVNWESQNGYKVDINAKETLEVATKFYNIKGKVFYDQEVTLGKIKKLLADGIPIIIPAAGQILANPHYTGDGPEYHMLVIKGYNEKKGVFITNDPGTRLGENYEYTYETVYNATHDWIGSKDTITQGRKSMLILQDQTSRLP